MKFCSKPVEEHIEVPLADGGRLEDIIETWQDNRPGAQLQGEQGNLGFVVCIATNRHTNLDGKLAEMLGLLDTLDEAICGHRQYRLTHPNPKTLLGSGKLSEIADCARKAGANMLVIDARLTPSQTRNIEMATGFAVCDREGTILNVFLRHAQTRAARIQVEIARLEYLKPRIRGIGLNMDQQAGGINASKGAGETASQLLARRLDSRLNQLQKSAEKLAKTAANQRKSRAGCKQIALVGYTNAGKTSLMNALTEAGLSARNAPFETLDTTTRQLSNQPGLQVLLSDTVGFIRELPETLLASFESTLAQTREADLLVLVVDVSDPECEMHLQTTRVVLDRLGAGHIPKFYVFNKTDLAAGATDTLYRQLCGGKQYMALSSKDGEAVKQLHDKLLDKVNDDSVSTRVFVHHSDSKTLSTLYANCRVLAADANESGTLFTIEATGQICKRVQTLATANCLKESTL